MRHGSAPSTRWCATTVAARARSRDCRDRFPAAITPDARKRAQATWDRLASGVAQAQRGGRQDRCLGTDGGGQQGDQFIGWTMHTELENMVMAGHAAGAGVWWRPRARRPRSSDSTTWAWSRAGKSADFVVLDANPLDDITNTQEDLERVPARPAGRSGEAASAFPRRTVDSSLGLPGPRTSSACGGDHDTPRQRGAEERVAVT